MAVFFTSLLPQFVLPAEATFVALMIHGALFASITVVWLSVCSTVIARMGGVLRRQRFQRGLDAVSGTVLVGVGLRAAIEQP
jgi:threonine/homoserine/homoserine lactone efflux protein